MQDSIEIVYIVDGTVYYEITDSIEVVYNV